MSITSKDFIAFLVILTVIYFVLPGRLKKLQWPVLLAASIFFYLMSGKTALLFLLVTAGVTYAAALWMDRENGRLKTALAEVGNGTDASPADLRAQKAALRESNKIRKRRYFVWVCLVIFGIWVVVKYSPMVLSTIQMIRPQMDLTGPVTIVDSFIVPLGISFYTFNAAGYVIDVSRKKYPAERNFLKYLLFISFFPHIIQGPFSRFDRLGKTLFEQHTFDYDRMAQGMRRMLYGYFQKLLIADKLAPTITAVMAAPDQYPGVYLFAAVIGYGLQLYCDFSGYMNIMIGFCKVLGIELEENFEQPYFSTSIQNYWTRWHITLGHWYSDYIFYPCSMGKTAQKLGRKARARFGARMGTLIPSYFAMIFVWTLTGLWHGANWTFVVWGWLNFAIIVFSMQMETGYTKAKKALHINDKAVWWRIVMIVRTFLIVSIIRIFYCSTSVGGAIHYIRLMFTPNWNLLGNPLQVLLTTWAPQKISLFYILFGIAVVFGVDLVKENKWELRVPAVFRGAAYGLLLSLIIIGAGGGNGAVGGFMYAQF